MKVSVTTPRMIVDGDHEGLASGLGPPIASVLDATGMVACYHG